MRSLASEHWQQISRSSSAVSDLAYSVNLGPEGEIGAKTELQAIETLFAHDDEGWAVMMAKAEGESPEEIRNMFKLTDTQYDSALKRMRRRLLQYQGRGTVQ